MFHAMFHVEHVNNMTVVTKCRQLRVMRAISSKSMFHVEHVEIVTLVIMLHTTALHVPQCGFYISQWFSRMFTCFTLCSTWNM